MKLRDLKWFGNLGWQGKVMFSVLALMLGTLPPAVAHTQSTAFLKLRVNDGQLAGDWHVALRDLQDAVGLDSNDDGLITWGELSTRSNAICAYAISHLHFLQGSVANPIRITRLLVDEHSDGGYAVLRFAVDGVDLAQSLTVSYQAFFEIDPKHRGLLRTEGEDSAQLLVFAPETAAQSLEILSHAASPLPPLAIVNEGVWHIWRGYDHILFLLALLLPGVLRRTSGGWEPVGAVRPAVLNVLKIVTAFTLAHSLTLSLAALGVVRLPTRFIESAIAGSVVLAALNNVIPLFSERGWVVAFGFGLLHGFGFANALRDLGLHAGQLAVTLFGFNLGVEAGQLVIVALFLPLALGLRRVAYYPSIVLRLGSVGIMSVSATWFAERLLNFKWLPF